MEPVYRQVASLNMLQYNKIKAEIEAALKEFAEEVGNIQYNSPELFSHAYYMDPKFDTYTNKNNDKILAEIFIEEGYYDKFYQQVNDGYQNPHLSGFYLYKEKVREILILQHKIDSIVNKEDEHTDSLQELALASGVIFNTNKRKSKLTSNFDKGEIVPHLVLAEDIPNLKVAEQKIAELGGVLYDYYEAIKDTEGIEKFKAYKNTPKQIVQEKIEETQEKKEYEKSKSKIEERLRNNKVLSINPLINTHSIPTVTTQTSDKIIDPIKQEKKVQTFTIEFPAIFSGRNNGKTLPSVKRYGSTPALGIIDYSKTSSLSGLIGVREDVAEPYTIDIDYKVDSVTSNQAKVIEETIKQVVPEIEVEAVPQVEVIDNRFSDYRKKEAGRIMTEYAEMRNSLHFYDWDAKVVDLVQKGNSKFKEIEDALSNSKKVTEQELIFATDWLDILRANLQIRTEELSYQELNRLHHAE